MIPYRIIFDTALIAEFMRIFINMTIPMLAPYTKIYTNLFLYVATNLSFKNWNKI